MTKVIIVGGGIVGAACALEAASRGAEVMLADAGLPGRATSAGAGIISPWSAHADDPELRAFTTAAAREYPALVERLAGYGSTDVGYRKVGALYLCEDAETTSRVYADLCRQCEKAPEMGDVHVLSGPAAQEMFPPLRDDQGAVYVPGAARVDGRLMAAALARAAAALGAVIRDEPARLVLRGPAPGGSGTGGSGTGGSGTGRAAVRGVEVAGKIIEGDAVVVAAGAWTSSVLEDAGLTGTGAAAKVTPQRGQIAHIALPGQDTRGWPVVLPVGTGHYLLAFDDSRVVAGATRETGSGFDYRVTPGGLCEVLNEAIRVAPGLATGTYIETRIGFRPASPDGRPLLGPVPGVDGLVVATGLGAEGLTAGPFAGTLAARVALGLPAGIDVTSFSPLRLPAQVRSVYRRDLVACWGDGTIRDEPRGHPSWHHVTRMSLPKSFTATAASMAAPPSASTTTAWPGWPRKSVSRPVSMPSIRTRCRPPPTRRRSPWTSARPRYTSRSGPNSAARSTMASTGCRANAIPSRPLVTRTYPEKSGHDIGRRRRGDRG